MASPLVGISGREGIVVPLGAEMKVAELLLLRVVPKSHEFAKGRTIVE